MVPVNISNDQPPHYICFNIIICCTSNICPRAVEQATQATTRENLSSGFPTKRVSNQSLRLNWLDRKYNFFFARGKSRDESSQKADNKVADETTWMRRLVWSLTVTNHRTVFLSRGPIAICVI